MRLNGMKKDYIGEAFQIFIIRDKINLYNNWKGHLDRIVQISRFHKNKIF
jgi:hypothetical protein